VLTITERAMMLIAGAKFVRAQFDGVTRSAMLPHVTRSAMLPHAVHRWPSWTTHEI
jgi:hypothetical protein